MAVGGGPQFTQTRQKLSIQVCQKDAPDVAPFTKALGLRSMKLIGTVLNGERLLLAFCLVLPPFAWRGYVTTVKAGTLMVSWLHMSRPQLLVVSFVLELS